MGSVCCCIRAEDFEDYVNPESAVYRNCTCVRCFIQNFLNVYASLFQRGEVHSASASIQGATSTTSPSLDNSLSDMFHSPPRPLPYDADPRYFRLQREGLVSRREKGSSHSNEDTEPLRSDTEADSESFSMRDKWNTSACEEGSIEQCARSSLKISSAKVSGKIGYVYSSSEDDDVCPTCLEDNGLLRGLFGSCINQKSKSVVFRDIYQPYLADFEHITNCKLGGHGSVVFSVPPSSCKTVNVKEYTVENPRIMTKCSHHFHLGCIYEWMERSDSCPVCGKVMVFDETT